MLREWGPQSLFVTFSCNEYESPDISCYLHKVNDVPENYDISKLCNEDPISVSRQFAHKFHAFFQTMIVKGEALGIVDHFYWKKEFQARGAPHIHSLLWIRGAPIIGKDPPEKIIAWLEERITCHIPDETNNPELHYLVKRYQVHKCCKYCQRRRKVGGVFVTTCRFCFPRQPRERTVLYNVTSTAKKFQKAYEMARLPTEVITIPSWIFST